MTLVNDDRAATRVVASRARTSHTPAHRIRTARSHDATRLASALTAAFYDDPAFRWFSPDDHRRAAMLPRFFAVLVEAFRIHGETHTGDDVAGAALWAAPGTDPLRMDPGYAGRLEEIAGVDAQRMFEIIEIFDAHAPQGPSYHLKLLGLLPERHGVGLAGALMAPILQRSDRNGVPAYLEATSDRDRALYEHHGFRAERAIRLPGGPTVWRMWRDPVG